MKLIVDSNRILSALIKDGLTRKLLFSKEFEFYTPDYVLEEVREYKEYVVKKTGMTFEQIELLFQIVLENINIIPEEKVKKKMEEAIKIMENIDRDDSPILACALVVPNDGIWTEDKHFEKQTKVKVWKTEELITILEGR